MKLTKGIAVTLAAAIIASGGGIATTLATAPAAYAASTQSEIDAAINKILVDTNAERAKAGLSPLKMAPSINTVAQNWTLAMDAKNSMAHNPNYPWEMPQPWMRVGENVAQGYVPSTVVTAWMNSEGHRANILGDFTHIGLGYWVDENGRAWFTQNFGKYEVVGTPSEINEPDITVDKHELSATWVPKDEYVTDYKVELLDTAGTVLQTQTVQSPNVSFVGLNDLTEYQVQVTARATDVPGATYTSPVKTVSVTTLEDLPEVSEPTNLTVTPGENQLEVTWDGPEVAYGTPQPYKVELKDGLTVLQTVETVDPYHVFLGLRSNKEYTIDVTASTTVKTKTASATATQTSRTLASSVAQVSEPTNVSVISDTHSSVKATWGAPATQVGKNLKYKVTLSTAGKTDVIVETTSLTQSFTGLVSNTPYAVKIQASIVSEDGVNSATSTGVTTNVRTLVNQDAVSVSAPTLKTVQVAAKQAELSWTAPANVVGNLGDYTVTVKRTGQPDLVFKTPNTSYTVTGLLENTSYTFQVTANATSLNGKNTAFANSVTATHTTPYAPDTVIVSAPQSLTVTAPNHNEVTASWSTPAQLAGTLTDYTVTLKQTGQPDRVFQTVTPNFTVSDLTANTVYSVEVAANAVSPDGTKTATSASVSGEITTPYPADEVSVNAPTDLTISAVVSNSMIASWKAPTGTIGEITGYTVTLKQGTTVKGVFKTTNTSYSLNGLTSNTAYTVEVQAEAVSGNGVNTATSTAVTANATTVKSDVASVAIPAVTISAVASDRFTVSWAKPAYTGSLTAYKVYVRQGTTTIRTINLGAAYTSTLVTGLAERTAYTVIVEAYAVAENGRIAKSISAPKSVTTALSAASTVKVGVPTYLAGSSTTNSVTATWRTPAVTGRLLNYTVILKQGTRTIRTVTTTGLKAVFGSLPEKTTYVVYVRANAASANYKYTASSAYVTKAITTQTTAASKVAVGAPRYLTLYSSRSVITATWSRPAVTGILVNYTVRIKLGTTVVSTYTTTGGKVNFYGLRANTPYTVTVTANAKSLNGKYRASATSTKTIWTKR